MAESIPTQIAETIQTAHIQRAPSPRHDLNPSSSMSEKRPVRLSSSSSSRRQQQRTRRRGGAHRRRSYGDIDDVDDLDDEGDEGDEDEDGEEDGDEDDIPISVLRPRPRTRKSFPPMPDLRFEQSYLHSIAKADTWWRVGWITVRDQMMMPFAQGVLYNLAICGWHHWNKNARLSGNSTGARLRRWWYGVNKWPLPPSTSTSSSARSQMQGHRQLQFQTTQQHQAKPWSSFSFDTVVRFLERYEREAARFCQGWASAWKSTSSST